MNIAHVIFATIFGLIFLIAIRSLSVKGKLTMRYTLGWLSIGFFVLGYPILLIASKRLGRILVVQPSVILLGVPLVIVGVVCIQLSITVSGLTEQVRTLGENVAHLSQLAPEKGLRVENFETTETDI
jgi:hypothetical protein